MGGEGRGGGEGGGGLIDLIWKTFITIREPGNID